VASQPALGDIEAVFREKGIPLTRQRAVIWTFFSGADRAATIAEAAEALREQGVGQATVYRAVTLFTELGLLCRVQSRQGELCFTAPPIGHSHPLICGVCRRVVRFEGDGDLTALEARLTAETGFSIYGHHLEVYGICAACRAENEGAT
jgi:Fur family transcriptional regulator, ferric uptake regulator